MPTAVGGSTLPQAASEVTNDGIPLIAGCTKQNHCSQVQGMPKPRNFFSMTPASGRVSDHLVQALSKLAPSANLAGFRLEQSIPAGLSLDAGSVRPDATVEHRGGATHLSWSWENELASEPHTVTYRVSPLDAGRWDLAGGITLMDQNGSQSSTVLASQPLTATGPCGMTPTPTATATDQPPPTATRTPPPPTATNTPVPPTATPTATATPLPGPVYLPVAIREHCKPDERLGDIVLVIDASGSMDRSTEDGVPKKTAVLQTARAFVDRLDLSPNDAGQSDQVAVVGFNAEAWIQQPLTSDGAAISAALGALYDRQAAGTRLDLAFDGGLAALDPAARKPGNKPVIVLLTDGLPTGVPDDPASGRPEETVIAAAARARAAGVVIYTIGFGHGDESADPSDRVYPWLLAQCASDAGKTFVEPRADRLQEIYLEIADVFTCPEGRHDWGRAWP